MIWRVAFPSLNSSPRTGRLVGRIAGSLFVLLLAGPVQADPQSAAADAKRVRFNEDIRPIFAEHCVACHGGVKQASELSFVYRENVLAGGESGAPAVVPGDPEASYLIGACHRSGSRISHAAGRARPAPFG